MVASRMQRPRGSSNLAMIFKSLESVLPSSLLEGGSKDAVVQYQRIVLMETTKLDITAPP